MKIQSTNPAKNYELVGEVEVSSEKEIEQAVASAHQAKQQWFKTSVKQRAKHLKPLLDLIKQNEKKFAELISAETGKASKEAQAEVTDSINEIKDYIKQAPVHLADEIIHEDDHAIEKVAYEPWGVTAIIIPWNYPLEMLVWGVVPVLLAGNTVILKPSEETSLTAKAFADLIEQLSLPAGVFNIIYGHGKAGQTLIDQDIDFVWFTGSTKVGQQIYSQAGQKFIKAVLELGGSSPAVVFKDADIKTAVSEIVECRFQNCGQACSAVKRVFVQEDVFDQVVQELKIKIKQLKINKDIGSLAAKRQQELLSQQVQDALDKGAKVVCGAKIPNLKGAYYEPTLLTNITSDMRVYKEEVFGPVLSVMSFKTKQEAISKANDTIYGLSGFVYSQDKKLALEVANNIKAGRIGVNSRYYFHAECPFGGYKKSGMGREHGKYGFHEVSQIKHIHIRK